MAGPDGGGQVLAAGGDGATQCSVQDIVIACIDGLKGFPEAIEAVFPHTTVQLCIVHMVRHSLNYVSWKRRPEVAADLKRIYTCATVEEAEQRLAEFESRWDKGYLPIGQSWRRNWPRLTPFFDYPPEIRKVIYKTNAIESVNTGLRKLTKHPGAFPSDEALMKAALPGAAQHQQAVDLADPRLESGPEPFYDAVRGVDPSAVTQIPLTQKSAHAPG